MACVFCELGADRIVLENGLAVVIRDAYPVSPGHTLVVFRRHVSSYFEVSAEERRALFDLVEQAKELLDAEFRPDGYNIGINVGPAAGQTVFHLHVHLIPRYAGDVDDPMGGVRGVIPGKRRYGE